MTDTALTGGSEEVGELGDLGLLFEELGGPGHHGSPEEAAPGGIGRAEGLGLAGGPAA